MATDSGFSNQKKKGLSQFETVHNLSSSSFGKVAASKGLYQITASTAISSVADVLGANGQIEFWAVTFTSHGASVGNVARFLSGSLVNFEFEVIQVIDANVFYILPISEVKPSTEDCTILGWVTIKLGSDGSTSVSISSSDVSFQRNGASQVVIEDTVTPANNRPLPVNIPNTVADDGGAQTSRGLMIMGHNGAGVAKHFRTDTTGKLIVIDQTTVSPLAKARIDFSTTSVTTGAWVQLIASVGGTLVRRVQIFMSQGNTLELGFGAAASEVSQIYIFPGGNEVFEMEIPANTRLSVRAISSTANTGELLVNLLG
jgi:hypothetical protein